MAKKKDTAKTETTATAHEVKLETPGESDLPAGKTTEVETFKKETGFDLPELGSEKPEKRKCDVLRIRKSNTRNQLFESDLGKQFIAAARAEVKNSEIQEDKDWFIIWEVLED